MEGKHVNTGEALRFGWNAFKERAGFLIIMMIVSMIIVMVPYGLAIAVMDRSTLLGALCFLVYYVITFVIGIGYMKIGLKIVDGQKPEMNDLWSHTSLLLNYVLGTLLYGLIVAGGMLLFIVPGVIWAIKYYFTPFILVDKNMKPMEALRLSATMTDGIRLDLFGFLVVVGLVATAGYLALFIGLFVSVPVAMLAVAYTYRMLDKQIHGATPTAAPAQPTTPEVLK